MTEYTSKQVQIFKPESMVYTALSSFGNFTPIIADKVDGWQASDDRCSFRAQGIDVRLAMIEREPFKLIKIGGDDMPFEFYLWIQLHHISDTECRLRLTVHAKLNVMLKMMIGKKLEKGIDDMADQIAKAFNSF